jgi:hypothetical protein
MGQIGPLLGARLHGRRLTVVPPDERAWPYRCHYANEETLVTGGGDLRYLAIGTMIAPEGAECAQRQVHGHGRGAAGRAGNEAAAVGHGAARRRSRLLGGRGGAVHW